MRYALTAAALLFALMLLPAVVSAQVPDPGCTPAEEQYEGDCNDEVVVIVDPPSDSPSNSTGGGDGPGVDQDPSANVLEGAAGDLAGDADAPPVIGGSVGPVSPAPANAPALATASASASADSSAYPSVLPETGGLGRVALVAAVALVSSGLLACRVISRS